VTVLLSLSTTAEVSKSADTYSDITHKLYHSQLSQRPPAVNQIQHIQYNYN